MMEDQPTRQIGDAAASRPASLGRGWVVTIAVWGITIAMGLLGLWRYSMTPGSSSTAAAVLPTDATLVGRAGTSMLVMTVHPECPCSRASIGELEILLARVGQRVTTYVLFDQPAGVAQDPTASDLWATASRLSGVKVLIDQDGKLAKSLGAETSGEVFLYDESGKLRFNGGITAARGHAGDNGGREAIEAIVSTGSAATRSTPVFGCGLW